MNTSQHLYKIQAPTLPNPILHRESLIHSLAHSIEPLEADQATSTKLILLCAPAGYGKTTLLVDTIQQFSIPCCWYFLEASDTPAVFLRGLITSVQQSFPELSQHVDTLPPSTDEAIDEHPDKEIYWEGFITQLVDILNSHISQPFVLVLGNYHKLQQNETINHLINHLLTRPLFHGVLVIESRSLPNLQLASLIAHSQMLGLGSNKLRFTAQELYDLALLQGFPSFSLQEATYLTDSFDGWIAGILLGSSLGYMQMHPLAPSHKGNWGTLAQLADHQQLSIYLRNEVFSQEGAIYEFLESVSILDQLTAERCNTLLDIPDAAERLIHAEQQGLFVARSEKSVNDDEVGIYICNPILRELFQEQLRSQSFARYLELHRKAAYLLQRDQEYEQALIHALEAQEYDMAIGLIRQIAPVLVTQGSSKIVDLWLDKLPEEILKQDPWLLMIIVNIHLTRNEYAQVPSLIDSLETLLATSDESPQEEQLLHAELRLARSKLLFYQGNFQTSQALCEEVLDLLPADEIPLRIRTHQRLGVCLTVGMGRISEGIVQFQQALQLNTVQNDERQAATLHRLLASTYSWAGNYALADYHQTRALGIWESLYEPWGIINNLTSMGLLQLRQGKTREAEETLLRALHLAKDVYHFKSGEAYALVTLGELCCTQRQYMDALTYLEDGLRLARQCEDSYLIHAGLCCIATTYLFMGELHTSQFFLNQVKLQHQEEYTYEGLLRDLTQGRLSLALGAYGQAQQELAHMVTLSETTDIRFLHIQALLVLVVCYARQHKMSEAWQAAKKVIELNTSQVFDYLLQIEAQYYPELPTILAQIAQDNQIEASSAPVISLVSLQSFQLSSNTIIETPPAHRKNGITSLRIHAFGEPKLLIDDIPITHWHMTRAQELFFLFLEHAHPLSKDKIIDALWPHTTHEQIDTTMRTTIYYLRQAIGKACVVYQSGLYSLNLSALYGSENWYDVALFDAYYNTAKKALEEQNTLAARTAFAELVLLYKGDYLQPFYNDWCIPRRDQLRQVYMDARKQLALLAWQEENWEESIEHWQSLLSCDPCFEKAYYWIMRIYLKLGKRELALRQYQLCCQHLQDELATTPGTSIQKLYQRIK